MINPFVAIWLGLDAVAIVALVRLLRAGTPSARTSAIVMAALQLAALGAGVVSASGIADDNDVVAYFLIMATIVMVNLALGVAGLRVGARRLAQLGIAGTVGAVGLGILVATFSAIILLGAAFLPESGRPNVARPAE